MRVAENDASMRAVINAAFGVKIADANHDPKVEMEVIKKVTLWRAYVGATKVDERGKQISFEADFLIKHYPNLTLDDLSLCIDMFVTQQLDLPEKSFVVFSPMFMGLVLDKYRSFKNRKAIELGEKLNTLPPPEKPKPTPKERAESMKEMIMGVHEQINKGNLFIFMIHDVYDYFRRLKKIVFTDKMIEEAKKYAVVKMSISDKEDGFKKALADMHINKKDREDVHRWFCKEYCVKDYFRTHRLEDIINQVEEKHFSS